MLKGSSRWKRVSRQEWNEESAEVERDAVCPFFAKGWLEQSSPLSTYFIRHFFIR